MYLRSGLGETHHFAELVHVRFAGHLDTVVEHLDLLLGWNWRRHGDLWFGGRLERVGNGGRVEVFECWWLKSWNDDEKGRGYERQGKKEKLKLGR